MKALLIILCVFVCGSIIAQSPHYVDNKKIVFFNKNYVNGTVALYLRPSVSNITALTQGNAYESFQVQSNVAWTAISDQSWLTINYWTVISSGVSILYYSYSENLTGSTRVGHVTLEGSGVSDVVITVTQPSGSVPYAADYYVSPTGSDANPGTLAQPFATLSKAWTVVSAGKLIYVRGGTYLLHNQLELINKSGTSGNLIKVWAYPGETPVFNPAGDFAWSGGEDNTSLVYFSGNYVHFKGVDISYSPKTASNALANGFCLKDGSNNIVELCKFHHNEGNGFLIAGSSGSDVVQNNQIINCDFYYNYGAAHPGDSDGFHAGYISNATGTNYITGCRSWSNADDGYDTHGSDMKWVCSNCWAFWSGCIPGTSTKVGDGNGYKCGVTNSYYPTVKREYYNCLAFENQRYGFSQEETDAKILFYNNTAYKNGLAAGGYGFVFNEFGDIQTFRNNLSYANITGAYYWGSIDHDDTYNSWNGSVTVNDTDFQSIDSSQMTSARQADGSLPSVIFLRPATGSDLIGAGTNMGYGTNIGAF